jgi:hypothetical protein
LGVADTAGRMTWLVLGAALLWLALIVWAFWELHGSNSDQRELLSKLDRLIETQEDIVKHLDRLGDLMMGRSR